jgi:hypothetical protein
MSQSKLSLSVKGYEDVDDGNGNLMTLYIVRVEEASKNVYYVLKKRYTDFSRLYTALKERFPEIDSFRFPNKSIFNTNAQFTKDRRRQGFDDFLKITTTMNPIPTELIEFLEIEQHYRDYYSRQPAVTTTATVVAPSNNSNEGKAAADDDDTTATTTTTTTDSNNSNSTNTNTNSNNTKASNNNATRTETKSNTATSVTTTTSANNTTTTSSSNTNNAHKNMLETNSKQSQLIELLTSTLIYTTITYILCILLRIVDIRKTTIMKVVLTILALSSVVVFMRYQFLMGKEKIK